MKGFTLISVFGAAALAHPTGLVSASFAWPIIGIRPNEGGYSGGARMSATPVQTRLITSVPLPSRLDSTGLSLEMVITGASTVSTLSDSVPKMAAPALM